MASIAVVTETADLEQARRLLGRIGEGEGEVEGIELVVRERYPIADAMVRWLAGLDARFGLVLVLVSARPGASAWVLRELQLREHYPRCHALRVDAIGELSDAQLAELLALRRP